MRLVSTPFKEQGNKAYISTIFNGTWMEWLKIAEEMERGLRAYGHVVMRVNIDPRTFLDWCTAHGTSPGGHGRKSSVAAAVKERYGDQID